MADDWRVTVTLHQQAHVRRAVESVRDLKAEADLRHQLGHGVAVSVDGPQIFLYAGTEDAAREVNRVVRQVLAAHELDADFALDRWHPVEQDWQDAGAPLPQTAEQRQAEHQRLIDEETRESLSSGQAGWDVQVEMPSRHEAVQLADRLKAEGRPVIRRWRYLAVGANNEDEAAELAAEIRRDVPATATVTTEAVPPESLPFARVGRGD
ncbi:MAG TPA: hypothetical protein VGL63_13095 [Streptosporangiaceae bacterium]